MKITFIHTDLRIYWPTRLKALSTYLRGKGIYLEIVEISGAGSPYAFADKAEHDGLLWHILFPDKKMEAIDNHAIKRKLYQFLNKLQPDILICGAIALSQGVPVIGIYNESYWKEKIKGVLSMFDFKDSIYAFNDICSSDLFQKSDEMLKNLNNYRNNLFTRKQTLKEKAYYVHNIILNAARSLG